MIGYLALLIFFIIVPPTILHFTLKLIYQKNHKYGWNIQYLFKYLITLSFLPLLTLNNLDLGIKPVNNWSIILILVTALLAILGVKYAIKLKVVYLYMGGVYAAFMEEILYRGIIFGLANAIWNNIWISLIISCLAFGGWHLKNISWNRSWKITFNQFLYTAFWIGPIFGLIRIWTGDIYLAVLCHFLADSLVSLAPDWMRRWRLVHGGRRAFDSDDYLKQ